LVSTVITNYTFLFLFFIKGNHITVEVEVEVGAIVGGIVGVIMVAIGLVALASVYCPTLLSRSTNNQVGASKCEHRKYYYTS
jgi:hypothetical protein